MHSTFEDKVSEALCEELFRQYKERRDWEEPKDVIDGADFGMLAKAAIEAMRRYLDIAPDEVARALFALSTLPMFDLSTLPKTRVDL